MDEKRLEDESVSLDTKKEKDVKGVLNKVGKDIAEKVNDDTDNVKTKKDALVTCRYLFISVLDKILIIIFVFAFLSSTYAIFRGDISSLQYGFWSRVGRELLSLIIYAILYLFLNWLYKCIAKTMLCVTEEQIYMEMYVPLHRWELTIPLNKVTAINSYKFFWIFRAVVIHQYGKLPKVFFTWNAQEFKDKVEELLTHTNVKVNNQYESRNIINKNQYKYVAIFAGILVAIIALLGVVRFFAYMFSGERHMDGTYSYDNSSIVLNKDGTCELKLSSISYDVKSCEWTYSSDDKTVSLNYKYEVKGYWSSSYESSSTIYATYGDKALTYNGNVYKK